MSRFATLAFAFGLCVTVAGCGQGSQPYQRFVLIEQRSGGDATDDPYAAIAKPKRDSLPDRFKDSALALDTKTGRLCLTYEYKVDVDHPEWKDRNIPTCKSLYEKDPQ